VANWRIEGFDGTEKIFDHVVPGNLSDKEITTILQRLAARHLEPSETVFASLRKRMKGVRADLEINPIGGDRFGWMTVGNPHYLASREMGNPR
jgi:hypothetical protein